MFNTGKELKKGLEPIKKMIDDIEERKEYINTVTIILNHEHQYHFNEHVAGFILGTIITKYGALQTKTLTDEFLGALSKDLNNNKVMKDEFNQFLDREMASPSLTDLQKEAIEDLKAAVNK